MPPVAALVLLSLSGCEPAAPPDDAALAHIILRDVFAGGGLEVAQGSVIVIDSACFPSQPEWFSRTLTDMLKAAELRPITLEISCDASALPGEWMDFRFSRQNAKHRLAYVDVKGTGLRREVRWGYLCDKLMCGRGESYTATWDGRQWTLSDMSEFVN